MAWRGVRWGSRQGPVALDLGRHTLKAARLSARGAGARLDLLAARPTPPGAIDAEGRIADRVALTASLRAMAEDLDIVGADVAAVIATPLVRLATIELEARAGEDLGPLAAAELCRRYPEVSPDSAVSVMLLAAEAPEAADALGRATVLAAALPQDFVDGLLAVLDDAGFAPLVLEAAPLLGGGLLPAAEQGRPTIVADLGAGHTTLTHWRAGWPTEVRCLAADDDLSAALAELGRPPLVPTPPPVAVDPWAPPADPPLSPSEPDILQPIPADLVLHGGRAGDPQLRADLAASDGELRVADPLALLGLESADLPPEVAAEPATWVNVLALAGRPLEGVV